MGSRLKGNEFLCGGSTKLLILSVRISENEMNPINREIKSVLVDREIKRQSAREGEREQNVAVQGHL